MVMFLVRHPMVFVFLNLFDLLEFLVMLMTLIQIFFIFTILNTYVPLIFHAKIQPKISSGSGEKVDFAIFAIFSNGGHLGFST